MMHAQIFKEAGRGNKDLCWVEVGRREALMLVKSLASQLESGNTNTDRLESRCEGAFGELSIVVYSGVDTYKEGQPDTEEAEDESENDHCGKPCPPNSGCPPCDAYWHTMEQQGFWDGERHCWTDKGWQEIVNI